MAIARILVPIDFSECSGAAFTTAVELASIGDVDDPETQVLFLNNLSGMEMLLKTSWAELESGKHF